MRLDDDCEYEYHVGLYGGGYGGLYRSPILSLSLPLPIAIPVSFGSYGGIK